VAGAGFVCRYSAGVHRAKPVCELHFRVLSWRAPEARKLSYLEHLLTDYNAVKEVKLFGLGEPLLGRYGQLFWKFVTEDRVIAQKRSVAFAGWGMLATLDVFLRARDAWIVWRAVRPGRFSRWGDMTLRTLRPINTDPRSRIIQNRSGIASQQAATIIPEPKSLTSLTAIVIGEQVASRYESLRASRPLSPPESTRKCAIRQNWLLRDERRQSSDQNQNQRQATAKAKAKAAAS